jgi:hypothetical protein
MSTITRVSRSAARRSSAARVASPPTASLRSRPPTPIAWLTPSPSRSMSEVSSCRPVPEAPMHPIAPRRTWLAKPRRRPSMIAVPQSGPRRSRPRSAASRLSAASSSSSTLPENSMTFRPRRSALRASAAAYSPGTEMRARLACGADKCAWVSVLGRGFVVVDSLVLRSRRSPRARMACSNAASSVRPSSAMTRSLGAASSGRSSSPASASSPRFAGVAMTSDARRMPGRAASSVESCISATESR